MSESNPTQHADKFVRLEKSRSDPRNKGYHPPNPNAGQTGRIKESANQHRQTSDLVRVAGPARDPNVRIIPKGVHRGKKVGTWQEIPGTKVGGPLPGHSETLNRGRQYRKRFEATQTRRVPEGRRFSTLGPGITGPGMDRLADRLVALRLEMQRIGQ